MDAVSKAGFRTGRALRGLGGIALTAGVALASVFTTRMVRDALDYAASIGEVASQLGVTTKELQVYRYAATQVNLTQEELEKGLAKLSLTIGKAGSGAKNETQYFERLGIAVRDAEGAIRPTGDVLLDLADRLAAIPDPAQRAAAVFAIFGRQGQKLIPLLEGGSKGLRQFAKEAEQAGLVLTEGDIAKADETADKIEGLTKQLKVNFSRVVAQNADAILSFTNALGGLVGMLTRVAAWFAQNPKIAGVLFGGIVGGRFGGVPGALAGAAAGLVFTPEGQRSAAEIRQQIKDLEERGPVMAGGRRGVLGELFTVRSTNRNGEEYRRQLSQLQGELAKTEAAEKAMAAAAGAAAGDLDDLFAPAGGGGSGGRGGGRSVRDEIAAITNALGGLSDDIEAAFDTQILPESIERADELRRGLTELAAAAREAGVPAAQFAAEFATLAARIDELELAGLAEEAAEFARQVEEAGRTVQALDLGALTPLDQRLADVDDRYNDLADRIREQIDANSALAAANEDAARAMEALRALLGQVGEAHRKAADAARAQFAAEQALRDLAAEQAAQQIGNDITDLRRARGSEGVFSSGQLEAQQIERQLQSERLEALTRLREFEADRAEAERNADVEEVRRLTGLIDLQREYYNLVSATTAQQIIAAERLQAAFENLTDGLADALADMIVNFDFSLKGVVNVLRQTLQKLLSDTLSDTFGSVLQGGLKSLFAGGFATGGIIPRGQWGIVGERGPEPVFAADGPLRVLPNDVFAGRGSGSTFIWNVKADDADSFRRSERQMQNDARRRLAG